MFLTSTDGLTWQSQNSGNRLNVFGIGFANGLFVASGDAVLASTSGKNWTRQTGEWPTRICFGKNLFVGVGRSIFASSDGQTWSPRSLETTNSLADISFGNNRFVAVGIRGTILTSSDGITWQLQTIQSDTGSINTPPKAVQYAFTTFAGLAGFSGSTDGTGSAARFFRPYQVAVDSGGYVYVADCLNHTIRKVTPAGVGATLAGLANSRGSSDGTGSTARFDLP